MAWETLTWWLRHRELPAPTTTATPPSTHPSSAHLVARVSERLQERLLSGAGGDVFELEPVQELLRRASIEGEAVIVPLLEAWEAWPATGVGDPRLAPGARVLARVLDRALQATTDLEPEVVIAVARRAAQARPSLEPMEGLITVLERCVSGCERSPGLREAIEELRHGLPLEARGQRLRLQRLLGHLRPPSRG